MVGNGSPNREAVCGAYAVAAGFTHHRAGVLESDVDSLVPSRAILKVARRTALNPSPSIAAASMADPRGHDPFQG